MKKVSVRQLVRNHPDYINQEVEINGWVRTNRDQKSFGFLGLNDGTHFNTIQIVYEQDSLPDFDMATRIRTGAAIMVRGVVVATPGAKQDWEIKAKEIILLGDAAED
ncbi:MAG: OB-fold nucleic acid binding domain-containing protein, partial [Candidatus Omnitrophota bacterium]